MTDDEDTQRRLPEPRHLAPIDAVYRALAAVQAACAQLEVAMANQDAEGAEIAADDAVASWLAAKAAHQRLDVKQQGADAVLAQVALGAAQRAIIDQLERAVETIDVPWLHRRLHRLRLGLAIAHGEPPSNF